MMSTSIVNLLTSERHEPVDDLVNLLESLPSYGNLTKHEDASAIFDDENEPSTGLISLIRKNSIQLSRITPIDESSNSVRIIFI
jgi:hypothetical protein